MKAKNILEQGPARTIAWFQAKRAYIGLGEGFKDYSGFEGGRDLGKYSRGY
jgi:hypothetical protein